jgi:hypothetical protein
MNLTEALSRARATFTGGRGADLTRAPSPAVALSPIPPPGDSGEGAALASLLSGGHLDPTQPVLLVGKTGSGKTLALQELIDSRQDAEVYVAALHGHWNVDYGYEIAHRAVGVEASLTLTPSALQVVQARRSRTEAAAYATRPLVLAVESAPELLGYPEPHGGELAVRWADCNPAAVEPLEELLALGPPVGCTVYATTPRAALIPQRLLRHFQVVHMDWPFHVPAIRDYWELLESEKNGWWR